MKLHDKILLEHGGGGLLTGELIEQVFLPRLGNPHLRQLTDRLWLPLAINGSVSLPIPMW